MVELSGKVYEALKADTRPYLDWDTCQDFMCQAFERLGVPKEDAAICADVLMESDRRGIESHGVNRFKPIYVDRINKGILNPVTEMELIREFPATAVFDAHNGMGMVASKHAMDVAIEKAKACGTACVAVRNSSHYGIAGYWVSMATDQGLIGITGTNARPSIAPTFGVENMLGTNPLTIGLPCDEEYPFLLDCATSISQRGKLEYYANIGKDTPAGMVIGRDGSPLTDTPYILQALTSGDAALAPLGGIGEELGGYKGYGYATFVEIMSAALAGGKFLKALTCNDQDGNPKPYELGHFFIVIDPDKFVGRKEFEKIAGDIMRDLRASQKAAGEERIYTAGEKEWIAKEWRKDKGVPMSEAVQQEFIQVRDALNIDITFPFE